MFLMISAITAHKKSLACAVISEVYCTTLIFIDLGHPFISQPESSNKKTYKTLPSKSI